MGEQLLHGALGDVARRSILDETKAAKEAGCVPLESVEERREGTLPHIRYADKVTDRTVKLTAAIDAFAGALRPSKLRMFPEIEDLIEENGLRGTLSRLHQQLQDIQNEAKQARSLLSQSFHKVLPTLARKGDQSPYVYRAFDCLSKVLKKNKNSNLKANKNIFSCWGVALSADAECQD